VRTRHIYFTVAACAVVVYLGALWNLYAQDDIERIATSPLVHSWSGLWQSFITPYWQREEGSQLYRPLTVATFVLDWHLDGPALFHAVNVVWHAGVSVLLAVLLNSWCGAAAALVGGVLFAVHPVHVEAVANVVGRADLMAAAFSLLAVFAAVERGSVAWSTVCWLLGLLSKESAVVAPALIVAAWAFGFGRPARGRVAAFAVAWGAAGLGYALIRNHVLGAYPVFVAPLFFNQSPVAIRLTGVAGLTDVTRLLLFPLKLRADYSPEERTLVTSMLDGRVLAGLAALVAWGAWYYWARRRARPVETLGLVWIALAFLPVANLLFPIGVVIAERTLYLPSIGLAVAVGALAADLKGRQLALVAAGLAILGGVRSALRVPVWHDRYSVIRSIVRDSPKSYVGFVLAAPRLIIDGQVEQALQAAQIAGRIAPWDARSFIVGAHAAYKLGKPDVAAELLEQAHRACSGCLNIYRTQANLARTLGDSAIAESLMASAERGSHHGP